MRYVWMPRLLERIQASTDSVTDVVSTSTDVVPSLEQTQPSPSRCSSVNPHVTPSTSSSDSVSNKVVKSLQNNDINSKGYDISNHLFVCMI